MSQNLISGLNRFYLVFQHLKKKKNIIKTFTLEIRHSTLHAVCESDFTDFEFNIGHFSMKRINPILIQPHAELISPAIYQQPKIKLNKISISNQKRN